MSNENTPTTNDTLGLIGILEGFGISEIHIKLYLALLVRNKEFYEMFGSLFKPYDFASIDPDAPHEAMEFIFSAQKDFHSKGGNLITRDVLKNKIDFHFKQFRKDEKQKSGWYALVDEIFDTEELDVVVNYYTRQLADMLQTQEVKHIVYKSLEKYDKPIPLGGSRLVLLDIAAMATKAADIGVKDQGRAAIDIDEFSKIEFPSRKIIIDPWLKEQSVGMIDGPAGVGKTFFGVTCATGVTTQTLVGNWEVVNPVPCIYVDGEMDYRDMQERFKDLHAGKRLKSLRIVCDSYNVLNNLPRIFNLTEPDQRSALFRMCQKDKDPNIGLLLYLDNISCLFPGLDENAKKDWDVINTWQLDLKKAGIIVLDFHHQGKSGDQRGTSGHLDNIDTSIKLTFPESYKPEDGCRFKIHFKKKRVRDSGLHLIQDQEWHLITQEGSPEWIISSSKAKTKDEIFLLLAQGMSNRQIAKDLKMKSHSYVNKIKIKLTADGYFHTNGDLTEKGTQRLDSLKKEDDLQEE